MGTDRILSVVLSTDSLKIKREGVEEKVILHVRHEHGVGRARF